jgi:uncharacterized membrane protein
VSEARAALPATRDRVAVLLIVLGAALRFVALGQQSLGYDEILLVRNTWDGPEGGWLGTVFNVHGPLYLVLLSGWIRLVGHGEALLRVLSATFGALGLVLFHRLVGRVVDRATARVALLLLAVSPFFLWYSQEAKGYSLYFDLSLLALAAFLADLEHRTTASFLGMLFATLAACLSNLAGFFLFPLEATLLFTLGRADASRRFALQLVLTALLLAPWIQVGMESTGRPHLRGEGEVSDVPLAKGEIPTGPLGVVFTFYDFSVGHSFGPTVDDLKQHRARALVPHLPVLVPIGLLFAGLAAAGMWRADRRQRALLLPWVGLPVVVMIAISMVNLKAPNSRYAFLSLAPYLVLVALGVVALPGRALRVAAMAALLACAIVSDVQYFHSPRYWRPDARAAGALLRNEARPGDLIVIYADDYPIRYYLGGAAGFTTPPDSTFASEAAAGRWLEAHVPGTRRLWIAQYQSWWVDRSDHFVAACRLRYRFEREWRFTRLPVYRFALAPPATP